MIDYECEFFGGPADGQRKVVAPDENGRIPHVQEFAVLDGIPPLTKQPVLQRVKTRTATYVYAGDFCYKFDRFSFPDDLLNE